MKKLFIGIVVSFLIFMVSACSGESESTGGKKENEKKGSSEEAVQLNFWIYGSTNYEKLAEEYMKENPNVKLKINAGEMEDMHNNLFTSISAGSGAPDVALIEISAIAKFIEAQDQFYNLNDYGADKVKDHFLDWKWAQAQNADGDFQIGLPTDIGPTTLFYRTDVMEEAGFPTEPDQLAKEIQDWDDYYEAAKVIKEKTGKPITDSPELLFNAIRDQQDQQYFNEKDELIIEDTVKEAYNFTTKMIQEGYVGKNTLWKPEWTAAMANGDYATMPGAPGWMVVNVKENAPDASGKWSLTTIPGGAGNWGGSFLTIPKESKHPEEAFEFISWLTSPENQLKSFNDVGMFPSAPEIYTNEEFLATTDEYFSGASTAKTFVDAATSVKTVYMGKNYSIVNSELVTALMNVANEGSDPQAEWDAAVERIQAQLDRQ